MTILELFNLTQKGPWQTSGIDVQYRIEQYNNRLYIIFQQTSSKSDWKYNFTFPPIVYKKSPYPWRAHKGFTLLWHSVRDEILDKLAKLVTPATEIYLVGFSLGAALAILAHEDIQYHHPACYIKTFAFGAPRVAWLLPKIVKERLSGVRIFHRRGDIVQFVPPALLGYRHVGWRNRIGPIHFPWHTMHEPKEYRAYLA